MISQRLSGLTTSASSVPRSRSRTTATAMIVMVVCIRRAPMSPGHDEQRRLLVGVVPGADADVEAAAVSMPPRRRSSIERSRPSAVAALMAETATCGSEASTITWIAAARRLRRRSEKSGGITIPTFASPAVDQPGDLVEGPRLEAEREVPRVLERLQELLRLDVARLVEHDGRQVPDVRVDGVAEDEQEGDRDEQRERQATWDRAGAAPSPSTSSRGDACAVRRRRAAAAAAPCAPCPRRR